MYDFTGIETFLMWLVEAIQYVLVWLSPLADFLSSIGVAG